jgi:hypothetical protein
MSIQCMYLFFFFFEIDPVSVALTLPTRASPEAVCRSGPKNREELGSRGCYDDDPGLVELHIDAGRELDTLPRTVVNEGADPPEKHTWFHYCESEKSGTDN